MKATIEIRANKGQALTIARELLSPRLTRAGEWHYHDSIVTAHIHDVENITFASYVQVDLTSSALTSEQSIFDHLHLDMSLIDDENFADKVVFNGYAYEKAQRQHA